MLKYPILFVILALALWGITRQKTPVPAESLPAASPSEAPALPKGSDPTLSGGSAPPSSARTPLRAAIQATPATISTTPPKSDGRTVEFKVVDGLAVAYGDVILGKLEAGSQIDHGVYEPSTPLLWDKPEIPYLISPDLPNPQRVEGAVAYFNQHTPVTFVPRTNQTDALVFEVGSEHCFSALGRVGGLQPVKLARGCGTQEILHEMMHALGFVHEQSRTDRDQFVQVLWENIEDSFKPQFAIVPETLMEAMRGTPFDYRSIMLYRPDTFALHPGLLTLRATGSGSVAPVVDGISEGDVQRLKRLFRL